jgi:hypothetical protein
VVRQRLYPRLCYDVEFSNSQSNRVEIWIYHLALTFLRAAVECNSDYQWDGCVGCTRCILLQFRLSVKLAR